MVDLTTTNFDREVVIRSTADRLGCIYDAQKYDFIGPKDNFLNMDVDGCLFTNSQRLIDEQVGEINPNASNARRAELEKELAECAKRIKEEEAICIQVLGSSGQNEEEVKKILQNSKHYKEALKRYEDKLREYQMLRKLRDDILAERDPSQKRIDYDYVYTHCIVDEDACSLVTSNVGPGKLFASGGAVTMFNPVREFDPKVKRLRPYFENLPIIGVPYRLVGKMWVIATIYGTFEFATSLHVDDNSDNTDDTKRRYPETQVVHKTNSMTTSDALNMGFQLVKEEKRRRHI